METKTTPRDFFLWVGSMVAFYGSVIAFITLLFEYINHVYPDPLAYFADPLGGSVRFAMATLIVLTPITVGLIYFIRKSILADRSKEHTWIRRWAIMLTLFIAGATITIDLITLINTFLGGEITTRFFLKVLVMLLVAVGVFLHFWAELKGYWFIHPRRAHAVSIAAVVVALLSIIAGFVIIGTPAEMRLMRYDAQKVSDLQTLQYQVIDYYQQKRELPAAITDLNDPLRGFTLPVDPQGGTYRYERTANLSFSLCATFNAPSSDARGQGAYPMHATSYPGMMPDQNWNHEAGEQCFTRTLDPERFPPYPKPL